MAELHEVLKTVEELRAKLNTLSDGKPLINPKISFSSHALDDALNEYQRLMKDEPNHS